MDNNLNRNYKTPLAGSSKSVGRPKGAKNNVNLDSIKELLESLHTEVRIGNERITQLEERLSTTDNEVQLDPIPIRIPRKSTIKLPKHNLPTFSGKITEWLPFWQHFEHVVDSVDDEIINPIDKLIYLRDCLSGSPLSMIRHLPLINHSYKMAVDILLKEYGNQTHIIKSLYTQLNSLRKSGNTLTELRQFTDEVIQILMQLSSMTHVDVSNVMVIIEQRVPFWLTEKLVALEFNSTAVSINDVINCLKEAIRIKENSYQINNASNLVSKPQQQHKTFSITTKNSKSINLKSCLFCGEQHSSNQCDKYREVSSRIRRLTELQRCSRCVGRGHDASSCKSNVKCYKCLQSHSFLVCTGKTIPSTTLVTHVESERSSGVSVKSDVNEVLSHDNSSNNDHHILTQVCQIDNPVLLKCVKAFVFNPNHPEIKHEALVLLDDGSTTSYISTAFAKKLKLKTLNQTTLKFGVFNEPSPREIKSDLVSFMFVLKDRNHFEVQARTIPYLTQSVPHSIINNTQFSLNYKPIPYRYGSPDILIGGDNYYDLEITPKESLPSGFTLLDSLLGPILAGRGRAESAIEHINFVSATNYNSENIQTLDHKLSNFFSLENIGISESITKSISLVDFQNSIEFNGQRYEVPLPWKRFPPELSNNYGLCLGRLRSTLRFLSSHPDLLKLYNDTILDQLNLNIIEKVDEQPCSELVHYIPHHPIIRKDKNKLRIVYDASAKITKQANSLNDCLHSGPLLLQNLIGVLFRFRLYPVVVLCDIERAFLQVALKENDRNFTRFMWIKDLSLGYDIKNVVCYRFTRIAFGMTCSPFLLAATIINHFKTKNHLYSSDVLTNIYVDNILINGLDIKSAYNKAAAIKLEFKSIGMNLREFISNEEDACSFCEPSEFINNLNYKVLGIPWNNDKDTIFFKIHPPLKDGIISKQSVLSYIASIYDPMGLLSPGILPFKLFLQNLWQKNLKWPEELSMEDKIIWDRLIENVDCPIISISRKITNLNSSPFYHELHAFSDASFESFSCCIYLKTTYSSGKSEAKLIFAKSKVCPIRFKGIISIHRLELLGLLIATRAINFVRSQLLEDSLIKSSLNSRSFMWTDSSTILHWLRSSSKQDVFIENRLKEIASIPNIVCNYVSTHENPADVGSRGCKFSELSNNKLWWDGPLWLLNNTFPSFPDIPCFDSNFNNSRSFPIDITLTVNQSTQNLVDFDRFSSWEKLLNTICYVFRFISKISKKLNKLEQFKLLSNENSYFSIQERRHGQQWVFKLSQSVKPPSDQEKLSLSLFLDKFGLWRSEGRIFNCRLNSDAKNPLWLSPKCRCTHLYVYYVHLTMIHAGPVSVLNQLRLLVWIPQGRRVVSHIINKFCLTCRKLTVKPFVPPKYPQLPSERVQQSTVFSHTGIDYCGPFITNTNNKIWVVLYTCLSTRAVHLEYAESLCTEHFISSLRRFISRRGKPISIITDNGRQFILSKKLFNPTKVVRTKSPTILAAYQNYLSKNGINWTFVTERAPWKGGFYERMIGLLKHHIKRSFLKSKLPIDEIHTLLCEIEFLINSRPITFTSDTIVNPIPIRPIDFISPHINTNLLQPCELSTNILNNPSNQEVLVKIWKDSQSRLNLFWEHWHKQYLLALRERVQQINKISKFTNRLPKVGEVVLIYETNVPRGQWKMGIVNDQILDSNTRTVEITTSSKHVTRRAINQLYPLETTDC